jgi:hypothetical protein
LRAYYTTRGQIKQILERWKIEWRKYTWSTETCIFSLKISWKSSPALLNRQVPHLKTIETKFAYWCTWKLSSFWTTITIKWSCQPSTFQSWGGELCRCTSLIMYGQYYWTSFWQPLLLIWWWKGKVSLTGTNPNSERCLQTLWKLFIARFRRFRKYCSNLFNSK